MSEKHFIDQQAVIYNWKVLVVHTFINRVVCTYIISVANDNDHIDRNTPKNKLGRFDILISAEIYPTIEYQDQNKNCENWMCRFL